MRVCSECAPWVPSSGQFKEPPSTSISPPISYSWLLVVDFTHGHDRL